MAKQNQYKPLTVTHPGVTLEEKLSEIGMQHLFLLGFFKIQGAAFLTGYLFQPGFFPLNDAYRYRYWLSCQQGC